MNQTEFSAKLRAEVKRYKDGFRQDSAAFLVWYLVNFFRLDEQDARDTICDNSGDKGIDGIWIDETENNEEIYLFQSKFSPNDNVDQGDNDLRNFVGARSWFDSEKSVKELILGTANAELKSLITGLKIPERISKGWEVNLVFVTNKVLDTNAKEFLKANLDKLEADDAQNLFNKYTYVAEEEAVSAQTLLNVNIPQIIEYNLVPDIKVRVLAIQAKELLKLNGIKETTLFSKNVRYSLGQTRVNKDIRATIKKADEHAKFFLYHNGITLVCKKIEPSADAVKISDYSVINGCQSMITFYQNSLLLSDNIYVLLKIIEIPPNSQVSVDDITYWENNQNAITVRDLKANDLIQRAIQREFDAMFQHKVLYRRQRGDSKEGYDEVVERDEAAQLIAAFYLGEPQITHLRNSLFGERYFEVFSRNISAPKIYLAKEIYQVIDDNADRIKFKPINNYGLAKFFILHAVSEILREDTKGQEILNNPKDYVKDEDLKILKKAVEKLVQYLILDIDNFIEDWLREHDNFFDYKNFFKNKENVRTILQYVKTNHKKTLIRHPEDSFNNIFVGLKTTPSGQPSTPT